MLVTFIVSEGNLRRSALLFPFDVHGLADS